MLISHSKKFIFIHNYKTGGTSIKKALAKYDNRSFSTVPWKDKVKLLAGIYPKVYSGSIFNHSKASELQEILPDLIFHNYFKFGFVRNPWSWQVSIYNHMLRKKDHHQHHFVKTMRDFDEYIEWRVNEDLHLQKDFFYLEDVCLVDYIGKLENIENDFEEISKSINVQSQLSHVNKTNNGQDHYLNYYSIKSIDLIDKYFKEDIQLFGYEKPSI